MTSPVVQARLLAEQLTASGIRATINPKDVAPPCVLITPPEVVTLNRGCGGTADMTALYLVPGPGQLEAWERLDGGIRDVLAVIPAETIRTTTYQMDSSGPMPAYELRWTASVDWS